MPLTEEAETVAHWHQDNRFGESSCRLSSSCVACDVIADSSGTIAYDAFPFLNLLPSEAFPR